MVGFNPFNELLKGSVFFLELLIELFGDLIDAEGLPDFCRCLNQREGFFLVQRNSDLGNSLDQCLAGRT